MDKKPLAPLTELVSINISLEGCTEPGVRFLLAPPAPVLHLFLLLLSQQLISPRALMSALGALYLTEVH